MRKNFELPQQFKSEDAPEKIKKGVGESFPLIRDGEVIKDDDIRALYQSESVGRSGVIRSNQARKKKPSLDEIESRRDTYPDGSMVEYQAYQGKFPQDYEND